MTCLFDVNALIALGYLQHEFSNRLAAWMGSQHSLIVATCPITETGFVRVLSSNSRYGVTVEQARSFLISLITGNDLMLKFIPDDQDIARLPQWVRFPKQVTDGHLVQLAAAHSITLATFDERIPGAFLIP
jgi:predicted nucleic acid-binding protein